jgi:hypothetical protein
MNIVIPRRASRRSFSLSSFRFSDNGCHLSNIFVGCIHERKRCCCAVILRASLTKCKRLLRQIDMSEYIRKMICF